MKRDLFTHKRLALIGLILSLILLVISMTGTGRALDTEAVAEKVSAKVEKRLQVLDGHINKALQTMPEELMMPDRIPDDMVIYLYVNDSLMSWNNQFPILNDRISVKVPFERMMPANNRITSPLTGITEVPEYMNLGSKWYIVKSVKGENNNMVIAGLEIKNSLMGDISRNANGANPKLKVPETHTVNPINETGGSAVYIGGRPIFKISFDPVRQNNFVGHSTLRWCSLLLFITVMVVFLAGRRTFRTYFIVVSTLTILLVVSYIWGIMVTSI